jgi:predicted  nucleic acid-binding Zn-ribbon protein
MESGTLKLVEEKRITSEMSRLRQSLRVVESQEGLQKNIDEEKKRADELFAQTRLRDEELNNLKSEYEQIAQELGALNEQQDSKFTVLKSQRDQRTTLSKQIDELYERRRTLRDEFQKSKDAYTEFIKEEKERKKRDFEERKQREQVERRQRKAEAEREMAELPAYSEEISLCNTLISYLNQYLPEDQRRITTGVPLQENSSQFNIRKVEASVPDGAVALTKKGNRDDEEDFFMGAKKKKATKARGQRSAPTATTALKLPLETMESFWKLKITVPLVHGEVGNCIDELEKKRMFFEGDQARKTKENKEKAEAKIQSIMKGLEITDEEKASLSGAEDE